MTPAQLDHLYRIKRHLKNLLANAKKRSQGEWKVYENESLSIFTKERIGVTPIQGCDVANTNIVGFTDDQCRLNAAFIASCAGNAEAGWTYALKNLKTWLRTYDEAISQEIKDLASCQLNDILAAWPIEKLP